MSSMDVDTAQPVQVLLTSAEFRSLLETLKALQQANVPDSDPTYQTLLKAAKAQLGLHQLNTEARAQVATFRHLARSILPATDVLAAATLGVTTTETDRPPLLHKPLSINFLTQERDRIVAAKISTRIHELNAIIPTLKDQELITRAQIELRQLNLLPLQQHIRSQFVSELRNFPASVTSDRKALFRPRRWLHPDQVTTQEKLERQRREDGKAFLQKRRNEFLTAVMSHSKNFKDFHMNRLANIRKVTRQVVKYVTNKERREQKERINALKKNDETKYLELLKKQKNERMLVIIEQTDKYLREIGELVEKEQEKEEEELLKLEIEAERDPEKEAALRKRLEARRESVAKAKEGPEATEGALEIRKAYYTKIHKIQEEVKEQPKMLKGGKLKEYQLDGLQWMVSLYNNKLNGILADEMGLGKTIQSIALITYLIEGKANHGPYLVIAPLATLSNWRNEFKHWAPDVSVIVYRGNPAERKKLQTERLSQKFNVLLTTYEYVLKDKSALTRIKWNYVIVDEGHRMKNHACKLSQTLGKVYQAQHRIILTGTPLQNNLPELWSLLNFLLPNIFNSVDTFEQWFNKPFEGLGEKRDEMLNEEESLLIINRLHKLLRPFLLRRLKSEVESQLPDKVEKVIKCDMSALQKHMSDLLRDSGVLLVRQEDGRVSQKGLSNVMMQLRKVANHPYLMPPFSDWEPARDENLIRASGKFDFLDRVLPKLKHSGHRVLLFSQMTALLDLMEVFLTYRGYKHMRLDGGTRGDDRGGLLDQFNAKGSDFFIFILSTRAGGLGLNLQTADTVIIFDSDWNPQMDLQAQDRAHRIGQQKEVLVLRMVTVNSIEEKILERANFKLDMDAKVINAGKFNKNATASERKEYLMNLLKADKNEDEEDADGAAVPTDKQVNQMIARSEEEYKLFQQMDKQRDAQDKESARLKGLPAPLPRLIVDDEVPPEMRQTLESHKEAKQRVAEESYGRGMRKRGAVYYNDNMSEERWLQLVEEGKDVDQYQKELADKRRAKQEKAATGQADDAMAVDDEPEFVDDELVDDFGGDPDMNYRKRKRSDEALPYHFSSFEEESSAKRPKGEEANGASAAAPPPGAAPIRKIKISAGKVTLQQLGQ